MTDPPTITFSRKFMPKDSHYWPGQALRNPGRLRVPKFLDNRPMEVLRLSALGTGRLYPPGIALILISVRGLVDPRATVRSE
jgi:hypothetical protein